MNSKALTAAAIAGVVIGLVSGLPVLNFINCLLCAGIWGGGILAVWLYMRQSGATSVTQQEGIMMGLVAGIIGGLIAGVLGMLFSGASSAAIAEAMRSQLETMPPEQAAQMAPMLDAMASGGLGVIGICVNVVISAIFGLIGGLIGAATIGKPKQLTGTM
jgi:hypothetical protein